MLVGVQALPVKSEDPGPEIKTILLSGFAISTTANPTAEFVRSAITSTRSISNHCRAIAAPMSGLFWWSAAIISMRFPSIVQSNSSEAMRAASTEPGPDAVESGPFISAITPILITLSPPRAGPVAARPAARTRTRQLVCAAALVMVVNAPEATIEFRKAVRDCMAVLLFEQGSGAHRKPRRA